MKTSFQCLLAYTLVSLLSSCCSNPQTQSMGRGENAGSPRGGALRTSARWLSVHALLADPDRFNGQDVRLEAFFSSSEGQFFLSPDLVSLAQGVAANLIYMDADNCRNKQKLLQEGNPAHCYITGTVDAKDTGPLPHSPYACTFRAKECVMVVRVLNER